MRAIGTEALLGAWDRGHAFSREEWALSLLVDAGAGARDEERTIARWPVGRRDLALLELRRLQFGRALAGLARCPACDEQTEFEATTDQLIADAPDDAKEASFRIEADGFTVEFRAITTDDLIAISPCPEPEAAMQRLLARCVLGAQRDGEAVSAHALPAHVADALSERLEHADPQADVRLAMQCPACGHHWQETFDIVSFLWREIETWAVRLMRDVHDLASAYGWSEREILALSPARRRFYIGMLVT